MSESIDISNLDKCAVLRVLYDNAKAQGMGFLHYEPDPMTLEEATEALSRSTYFDYHKGRVMKVDLKGDTLDPWLYDRDNGDGAAAAAIAGILPASDEESPPHVRPMSHAPSDE